MGGKDATSRQWDAGHVRRGCDSGELGPAKAVAGAATQRQLDAMGGGLYPNGTVRGRYP